MIYFYDKEESIKDKEQRKKEMSHNREAFGLLREITLLATAAGGLFLTGWAIKDRLEK